MKIISFIKNYILYSSILLILYNCSAIVPSYNNPMDGANGFIANLLLSSKSNSITNTLSIGESPTEIEEGTTKTLTVRLSLKSMSDTTITITSDCKCFDFNGSSIATLIFTPENSTIEQELLVTALIDSNTTSEISNISFTSSEIEPSYLNIQNLETGTSFIEFNDPKLYSNGDAIKVKLKAKPKDDYSITLELGNTFNGLSVGELNYTFNSNNYNLEQSIITVDNISNLLLSKIFYENSQKLTIYTVDNGIFSYQNLLLDIDKPLIATSDIDYTDNQDGTITDSLNNLKWQECTAIQSNSSGEKCNFNPKINLNFIDALTYCDNLVLGNSSNWRLPTRSELTTLIIPNNFPTIQTIFKPYTATSIYWSSTSVDTLSISVGDFISGEILNNMGRTNLFLIRCVTSL
jgi:hypothetical protein